MQRGKELFASHGQITEDRRRGEGALGVLADPLCEFRPRDVNFALRFKQTIVQLADRTLS